MKIAIELKRGWSFNTAWIHIYIHYKVWDGITYPLSISVQPFGVRVGLCEVLCRYFILSHLFPLDIHKNTLKQSQYWKQSCWVSLILLMI